MRIYFTAALALVASWAQALTATIHKYQDAPCGQPLGNLLVDVTGGVGPYSYMWNNGATTHFLEGLYPGTYAVTVTDGNNEQASATETILDLPAHAVPVSSIPFSHCPGEDPIAVIHFDEGGLFHGPWPHTISDPLNWVALPGQGGLFTFHHLIFPGETPGSTRTVHWADANGCPGTTDVQLSNVFQPPTMLSLTSVGACAGNNGSISGTILLEQSVMAGVHLSTSDGVPIGSGQNYWFDPGTYPFSFSSLAPGAYWVIMDPDGLDSWEPGNPYGLPSCADSFYVEVSDLTGACGTVQGSVYFDHDQDCVQDPGEQGVPDRLITITPGPYYAITNTDGTYQRRLLNGAYSMAVEGTGTELYPVCPSTETVDITIAGNVVAQSFADSSLLELDLQAAIAQNPARPGFEQTIWLEVKNLSGRLSGAVDAVLSIDPQFSFVSADPAPTNVSGNTITWAGADPLSGFERLRIRVLVQVPPDINLLGQPYAHVLDASQANGEADLSNNSATAYGTVQGSYDPNDKRAETSTRASDEFYFIDQDAWIDYTIRFQNTGTDTAFTVVVRDTISDELDLGTFVQGIVSHPCIVTMLPGRVIEWRFANILLPDSNMNEAESHGVITFRIRPAQPLQAGAILRNTAAIYFDFNPPVITEPSVLVAEFSTGVGEKRGGSITLSPVPASDRLTITGTSTIERLTLLSADGRVVLRANFRSMNGTLDLHQLSRGTFLLIAEMDDGTIMHERFVKH